MQKISASGPAGSSDKFSRLTKSALCVCNMDPHRRSDPPLRCGSLPTIIFSIISLSVSKSNMDSRILLSQAGRGHEMVGDHI
jgi:hypothetical protein